MLWSPESRTPGRACCAQVGFRVGSLTEFGRSLFGQIWRYADQILVIAEYDVYQLFQVEQEISQLNGQMADLQRELTIKNRKLERTLAELQ